MMLSRSFFLILSAIVVAHSQSSAFTSTTSSSFSRRQQQQQKQSSIQGATKMTTAGDTPETLPEFETVDKYMEYMATVSQLPKGFATGTADGTFISVEAPGLGNLKIRATVIHMTEGPTDSWAACFTSNKVRRK
jgi:hypothetical protein